MKIIKSWLKEWVDFNEPFHVLGEKLTMRGLEMESCEKVSPVFPHVVVGKILSVAKHPNADQLQKVSVFDGSATHALVCGDLTVKEGECVALAKPGAKIKDFEIQTRKVRGELSEGMLCSEEELGIGSESKGVMRFLNNEKLGQALHEALSLEDEVLEIGITPNRSDCLSVIGIAREVASITGNSLKMPAMSTVHTGSHTGQDVIQIEDAKDCFQYHGALIENVKMIHSPYWLKRRLQLSGIRSINVIVDLTNLILLELGQPMHAFDFDTLSKKMIQVRRAFKDESILALDGNLYTLSQDELVIADGVHPVAIAGIMGGELSGVSEKTKTLFFESAQFNPTVVRRASKRLGLKSESSYRFERGVDKSAVSLALHLACKRVQEWGIGTFRCVCSGGKVGGQKIETPHINIPHMTIPHMTIPLCAKDCNKVLGTEFDDPFVARCLHSLGIMALGIKEDSKNMYAIPSHRLDLERPIDLIEEVARVAGYETLPSLTENPELMYIEESELSRLESALSEIMVKNGFNEVINYTFVGEKECIDLSPVFPKGEHLLNIKNPLSPEFSVMRNAIIPGLVRNAQASLNHQISEVCLFEIGPVFPGLTVEDDVLKLSKNRIAFLMAGQKMPEIWGNKPRDMDFFDIKGIVEIILQSFNIHFTLKEIRDDQDMILYEIASFSGKIGVLVKLSTAKVLGLKLKVPVYAAELDADAILSMKQDSSVAIMPPCRFPKMSEDISFMVSQNVTHEHIVNAIHDLHIPDIEAVNVFDLFEGKGIPTGKKSLAYSVTYRNHSRTLTQDEVLLSQKKIKSMLIDAFGIEIR